jgi:hypothetical protein
MYESGISFVFDDESMGATPLWIVSTCIIGVADASRGNNERERSDFIVKAIDKVPCLSVAMETAEKERRKGRCTDG